MGIESLRRAGCRTVYIDGSFATSKEIPNDFDACWEEAGVEPELLGPVLLRFDVGSAEQEARYLGKPDYPGAGPLSRSRAFVRVPQAHLQESLQPVYRGTSSLNKDQLSAVWRARAVPDPHLHRDAALRRTPLDCKYRNMILFIRRARACGVALSGDVYAHRGDRGSVSFCRQH